MGTICSGTPELAMEMEQASLIQKTVVVHRGKVMGTDGPQTKEQALETVRHEAELRKGEWYQSRTKPFIMRD